MSYFLAVLWFITLLIASHFHERLRKAETLAQWEKHLRQGPNLSSRPFYFGDDNLEAWNANLLETLKKMRRNQWISKEEFRDMRKQLSFRYALIRESSQNDLKPGIDTYPVLRAATPAGERATI